MKSMIKKIIPKGIRSPIHTALLKLNTREKPSLDSESKEYLQKYFSDDVDNLQELIGKKLHWLD